MNTLYFILGAWAGAAGLGILFIYGAYRKDRESGLADEQQWIERREA
ncbi:hypothetical protein [Paraburkholderia atlantica]|nr:hypothetical protein [Paraburkholderia atlantica]MBB5414060.1 hypothetical protein [Paraburkholderia atlantica]